MRASSGKPCHRYTGLYICDGENPERPVIEKFLKDDNGNPTKSSEKLIKHIESEDFVGTAFNIGTAKLYEQLYYSSPKVEI